jgi:hypothetical protein
MGTGYGTTTPRRPHLACSSSDANDLEALHNQVRVSSDIRGLSDDPYRSLAWFVRKTGAFENSERNVAEFKWANFFREKRLLDRHGLAGMPHALARAVAIAQTSEAKLLPGFGKLNLEEKDKAVKRVKKKGVKLASQ